MSRFERTACCPKCGSVLLKVIPAFSRIDYVCSECDEYISTVDCDEYETINSSCGKCSNDTFKVKIAGNEESELWTPYCSKCNEKGSSRYTDREGRTIDEGEREVLILKDIITELIHKVDLLESNLIDVDDIADYIGESDLEEAVNALKVQVSNCSDNVLVINDLVLKLAKKFNIFEE